MLYFMNNKNKMEGFIMNKDNNVKENDIVLYNTEEIMKIFRCGRRQAYDMMNTGGFPAFKINSKYFVEKNALEKWIAKNAGKKIIT